MITYRQNKYVGSHFSLLLLRKGSENHFGLITLSYTVLLNPFTFVHLFLERVIFEYLKTIISKKCFLNLGDLGISQAICTISS